MNPAAYRSTVAGLRAQARFFRVVTLLLTVTVAALAGALLVQSAASERTVVVPSELRTKFWVEESRVSRGYYLEWGYFVAGLLLNVTPDSISYQNQVLLRHIAPQHRDRMRAELGAAAKRLRERGLSTFFAVSGVEVRDNEGRVAFSGSLSSYVHGRKISERAAAYALTFKVKRGQLALVEFAETEPRNVFKRIGA